MSTTRNTSLYTAQLFHTVTSRVFWTANVVCLSRCFSGLATHSYFVFPLFTNRFLFFDQSQIVFNSSRSFAKKVDKKDDAKSKNKAGKGNVQGM